jgi:hypothetical protein
MAKPRKPTSFYGEVLDRKKAAALDRARRLEGVDDVIAITHFALREAVHNVPRDLRLIFHGAESIAHLVTARHKISGREGTDDLIRRIEEVRGTFDLPNNDAPT